MLEVALVMCEMSVCSILALECCEGQLRLKLLFFFVSDEGVQCDREPEVKEGVASNEL